MKKVFLTTIKLIVTIGLFILLFWPEIFGLPPDTFGGVKPQHLWNEIASMNPAHAVPWILFALFIRLGGIMCGVIRWKILLAGQNIYIPFPYMIQSWFIGRTIGIFLPSTIGLDGYRLYDSIRYTGEVVKCTTVIFIEKIIGFISLTTLVFLTFPLGFKLLKFNTLFLLIILLILGIAVLFFLSILLQPYIIQIILYSIPTPGKIRNILIKLGNSATAYSGQKKYLLLATLCGIAVHLSACFMYFGTMMALKSENTSLWDVLFASPLMIYGTVLGPSIGGEGIREVVFTVLLGSKENPQKVVAFAHLGWWVGDVVPFLIGLPFLAFRKRPKKETIQFQLANSAQQGSSIPTDLYTLTTEEIINIRNTLIRNLLIAIAGAVLAGELCGLAEAWWTIQITPHITDFQSLWWGPLIYGIISIGLGLAIGFLIIGWLPLLIKKFPSGTFSFTNTFALTLLSLGYILILWRYRRDVLVQKPTSYLTYLPISLYYIGGTLILSSILYTIAFTARKILTPKRVIILLSVLILLPLISGLSYSQFAKPTQPKLTESPHNLPNPAHNYNIILIIADALRADYLPAYNKNIETKTPHLDEFIKDSILFTDCNSQASWTKPSFGSIFTSVLPHIHGGTTKNSPLNPNLPTIAEVLTKTGFYTKGYGNNPNVHSSFHFNKGYIEYTDLQPKRVFLAQETSAKLTIYEILRRIHAKISQLLHKFLKVPPDIRYFYHPAEDVNKDVLTWFHNYKHNNPFYLSIHYMDTHDPFYNRHNQKDFFARALLGDKPKSHLTKSLKDACISEIEYLDEHLGKLFSELKKSGIYQNSFIIFTSDHGEEFEEHGGWWHGFSLYQEMLHIPLIIKVPERLKSSENSNIQVTQMVRAIDIPATILECAGAEIPHSFQGIPLLTKDGKINYDNLSKISHSIAENDTVGQIMKSIRQGDNKLILANPDNPRGFAEQELYNLSDDPGEKNNLSNNPNFSEIKNLLLNLLQKTLTESTPKAVQTQQTQPTTKEIPPELKEQLKSLGYME